MWATWFSTVRTLMKRAAPISRSPWPAASRGRICTSRGVRLAPARYGGSCERRERLGNRLLRAQGPAGGPRCRERRFAKGGAGGGDGSIMRRQVLRHPEAVPDLIAQRLDRAQQPGAMFRLPDGDRDRRHARYRVDDHARAGSSPDLPQRLSVELQRPRVVALVARQVAKVAQRQDRP